MSLAPLLSPGGLGRNALVIALIARLALFPTPAGADVALADRPLFSTVSVPNNVLLALSVEFPTAHSPAYPSSVVYTPSDTYYGYFDAGKCYLYEYRTPARDSYFKPYGNASSHACASSAGTPLWSGNYLNWASMHTLDAFRWVMTGGQRIVDTESETILQKSYNNGPDDPKDGPATNVKQGGLDFTPNKTILDSGVIAGATPFKWNKIVTRTWGGGIKLWIGGSADKVNAGEKSDEPKLPAATDYVAQHSYAGGGADESQVYALYIRVKVCDSSVGTEANCVQYSKSAKPEGLMQANAMNLRFSAFGYLNSQEPIAGKGPAHRDGGVMRARMKYIGPRKPLPGSPPVSNPDGPEWDAGTGVLAASPNAPDASATVAAYGLDADAVPNSGVIRYLNDFGLSAKNYKHKDPVSELYYAAVRYYKKLGNVDEYSDMDGLSADQKRRMVDGFPVITDWTDPIRYSCQRNIILGIGDVNAVADTNLRGCALNAASTLEPNALPGKVAADTSVDVKVATDKVGLLEFGSAGLGSKYMDAKRKNGYFIAGLAYDSHTRDIRGDLRKTQTIDTYWADVLEREEYVAKNQYWLAAKFGGFKVPDNFDPYSANASEITESMWHTTQDTLTAPKATTSDLRPDNYFAAGRADTMKSGLTEAFRRMLIPKEPAVGTAYSTATVRLTLSGTASYSSNYDPHTWTGVVTGAEVTYSANAAAPTFAIKWNARDLLRNTPHAQRKIVTCCGIASGGVGIPFRDSSLGGSVSSRTYYASFAQVPGVESAKQSASGYLDYLRGDTSKEIATNDKGAIVGGIYRPRTELLGDIVDSKPNAVGAPDAPYRDVMNPGYSAFKLSQAARRTVVYVGANDGMMHAFDGSILPNDGGGRELFAYIPSFVYGDQGSSADSGLAALGNPAYADRHRFYVNATPQVFDVDFERVAGNTGAPDKDWRSLLIGGLGKGGRGYYALDVTDPPAAQASEDSVARKVLWEFPDAKTASDARMGYSYGDASVVKTKKYGWVVILTSGYNNKDGKGYFFFLNPKTGELLEAVATDEGSPTEPIQLAQHTAYVADYTDFTSDAVYAGDMRGNVWRVDLTASAGAYPAPTKIAMLAYGDLAQPVTTRPLIEVDPSSRKRYVMIGTGRMLDDTDIANEDRQSFYAIIDGTDQAFYTSSSLPTGVGFPIKRANLTENTNLLSGIGSAPTNPMGWYHDLGLSQSGVAERVNVNPTANGGIVAVPVNLPAITDPCEPGGSGRAIAVAFANGKSVLLDKGAQIASTGPTAGLITELALVRVGDKVRLIAGDRAGEVANPDGNFASGGSFKQLNWREVPTAN